MSVRDGRHLQIAVSERLHNSLKVEAAKKGTVVRDLVIQALATAGFKVTKADYGDRRGRGKSK